jgi:hypothetical protein
MFELCPNPVFFKHLLPSLSAGIDDRWCHVPMDLEYIIPAKDVQMHGAQEVITMEEDTEDEMPDLEDVEDEEMEEVQEVRVTEDGETITKSKDAEDIEEEGHMAPVSGYVAVPKLRDDSFYRCSHCGRTFSTRGEMR